MVLLAGELLKQCKQFIEDGVHPHAIIKAFRRATMLAINKINEIAIKVRKTERCIEGFKIFKSYQKDKHFLGFFFVTVFDENFNI